MSFAPGEIVAGKFRIEAKLGEGGMGEVFAARRLAIDDVVALKILRADLRSQSELTRRFLQEARAAAKIKHPGVVRILDAADETQPLLWIAMELLEGESLEARLGRGPLSPDEITALFAQMLDVLEHVHKVGIVHRDLKPSNVFLERAHGYGLQVRLLDFGIAKLADSKLGTYATQIGMFLGSLGYMSPEQMKQAKDVDARADLYAVGVMLYECLSGELPYPAETFGELIVKQHGGPPPPLAPSPDARLRHFGELAFACLQVNPGDRPADAAALQAALQRAPTSTPPRLVVADEPAPPPPAPQSPALPTDAPVTPAGPTHQRGPAKTEWWLYALGPLAALLLGAISLGMDRDEPATAEAQPVSPSLLAKPTMPSEQTENATASHILIRYAGALRTAAETTRSKDAARKLAEEVARKAAAPGADFAALADQYTEDPSGKGRGGRLGTFAKGRMVPEFDAPLFALRAGEVSGVVETPFGFHVIRREK